MELSPNVQNVVDAVGKLTVLELVELVKALEEKFGVSASAPVAVSTGSSFSGAPAGTAPTPAAPVEEKTAFSVFLTNVGDKKLQVIKEIRSVVDLGLKEAKDFVEGELPRAIKENIPREEAEKIKAKLEAVGAKVEIR